MQSPRRDVAKKVSVLICVCTALSCGLTERPERATADQREEQPMKKRSAVSSERRFDQGGGMSLKEALLTRRSVRSFIPRTLEEDELHDLLFAAQGVSSKHGFRTAPSAGATYPLELHVVTRKGVFQYIPKSDTVALLSTENRMPSLAAAALGQRYVEEASANFVFGGVESRTAVRYGARARRYVDIETGCAAQNRMLMAVARGLGSVMVGAYDDSEIKRIAELPDDCTPIVMVSVGVPK